MFSWAQTAPGRLTNYSTYFDFARCGLFYIPVPTDPTIDRPTYKTRIVLTLNLAIVPVGFPIGAIIPSVTG